MVEKKDNCASRGGGGTGAVVGDLGTKEETWDHHSSYQWTYFTEEIKQFIDFHLAKRLTGRNLDIGGGWYLPYQNSDVVDISSKALKYNPAPKYRKHHLDLDAISKGKKLPFGDNTFDSATMISVIQYLKAPWDVIYEIKRVLKPGAELYIIGAQDAGLYELRAERGFDNMGQVAKRIMSKNYDVLIEPIPTPQANTTEFSSICVAMPDENGVSAIRDKSRRMQEARSFDSKKFLRAWAVQEERIEVSKLNQIREYPITKYAKELLERIERFAKEYSKTTGNIPIFFNESLPQEFHMWLPYDHPFIYVATISCRESERFPRVPDEMLKHHGIRASNYSGFLPGTAADLDALLNKPDKEDMLHFARFLSITKLNSAAIDLEKRIWASVMQSGTFDYLVEVYRANAAMLHSTASQNKQKRRVDALIEKKMHIESRPDIISGHGSFEFETYRGSLMRTIDPLTSVSVPYYD
ncbi:MAG: class I SAM-dependent methyltransferase [Candidatus Micrarchaeota archaeon]|nr:class I SAM-dependent methyltransferase [Candidatus Micrarchaeota archaeon]